MRNLDLRQFEAVFLRQKLVDRDRLLAVGRAVIEHHDLLALELVQAAFPGGDVVHDSGSLAVGIEQQREDVREHAPVRGVGAAVVDGDQRHLVVSDAVDHGVGDADRKRVPGGNIRIALQPFVDLDALLDLILGLAFAPGQLDAVDATVADVDQIEVVDEAAEEAGAAGGIGADAIALQGEILFVGVDSRRAEHEGRGDRRFLEMTEEGHELRLLRCGSVRGCRAALSWTLADPSFQAVEEGRQPARFRDEEDDDEGAEHDALAHVEHARIEQVAKGEGARSGTEEAGRRR